MTTTTTTDVLMSRLMRETELDDAIIALEASAAIVQDDIAKLLARLTDNLTQRNRMLCERQEVSREIDAMLFGQCEHSNDD